VAIDLICRKIGMTQLFLDNGKCVPVTVLDASPNTVVDIKTEERDSYTALQLGAGERKESRFGKAELGHFKKKNVEPTQILAKRSIARSLPKARTSMFTGPQRAVAFPAS
jgi:large subunit ribosomal protein L3